MAIDKELLGQLDGRDPQELFARDGLIDELKKALAAEITLCAFSLVCDDMNPLLNARNALE